MECNKDNSDLMIVTCRCHDDSYWIMIVQLSWLFRRSWMTWQSKFDYDDRLVRNSWQRIGERNEITRARSWHETVLLSSTGQGGNSKKQKVLKEVRAWRNRNREYPALRKKKLQRSDCKFDTRCTTEASSEVIVRGYCPRIVCRDGSNASFSSKRISCWLASWRRSVFILHSLRSVQF